jgi:hypothetical protein
VLPLGWEGVRFVKVGPQFGSVALGSLRRNLPLLSPEAALDAARSQPSGLREKMAWRRQKDRGIIPPRETLNKVTMAHA